MKRTIACLALLALAAPLQAAEVKGQRFAETVRAGDVELALCSASLLRWKWVLDVYVAALYVDDCDRLPARPTGAPRRLEIAYLRGFEAQQFVDAAEKVLERTFDDATLAPLRERIDRMGAAYRAVSAGDRYALTYRPGVGTELALNGEPLVVVPGEDFADAYLAIWLGPDPADGGLRDRLLGGSRP